MPSGIAAIDMFCGIGGLSRGLLNSGIEVRAGIDLDPDCQFAFETNNDVEFKQQDVKTIRVGKLKWALQKSAVRILAGCAPCQPFSSMNRERARRSKRKWELLKSFLEIATSLKPHILTMENVPYLRTQNIFRTFVKGLTENGYHVWHDVVDSRHYGVPQTRRRLVLLASRLGQIDMIPPTHPNPEDWVTVRQAIGHLPPLEAGGRDPEDSLHFCSGLSAKNMERMLASKPGGTWKDWPTELRTKCHRKDSGSTYVSVYGRMSWDEPSPTITTQFFGFGNGRFGHPEQNRALSIREAAILQSFPSEYVVSENHESLHLTVAGKLIGNAVPVKLAEAVGNSIISHVNEYA